MDFENEPATPIGEAFVNTPPSTPYNDLQLEQPPRRQPREYIDGTPFAGPYRSIFTLQPPGSTQLPSLSHVNCSYLSTPGLAPTLLQLKQHAQSLIILIKSITISTLPAFIDNTNLSIENSTKFNDGETYDFLNDLSHPYEGPENEEQYRHHVMPLTALLNTLKETPSFEAANPVLAHHCPLQKVHRSIELPSDGTSLPYATHQTLIEHANKILELLDHEYSAKGGILGILPSKEEKEDRDKAESTLLGQLIVWVQRLVKRLHDLERNHASALDALAGEALVPSQTLSALGPEGRKGREISYPQDRFILSNCGEDFWQFLNQEFRKKEQIDEEIMEMNKRDGTTGSALWEEKGGKEVSRGIVALDVVTRYYRVKDAAKTVFIIPAHDKHPGTKVTREMESQPTVVAVVKPTWPERRSQWEMRHRKELEELKELRVLHEDAMDRLVSEEESVKVLMRELEGARARVRELEKVLDSPEGVKAKELMDQLAETNRARQQHEEQKKKYLNLKKGVEREKEKVDKELKALMKDRTEFVDERIRRGEKENQLDRKREETWAKIDKRQAVRGENIEKMLRERWERLIAETKELNELLKKYGIDLGDETLAEELEMVDNVARLAKLREDSIEEVEGEEQEEEEEEDVIDSP